VPDQTVNVTFDPAADPQFVFEPDEVTMTAKGKVIFLRRGASPTWTFTGGTVKDDTLKQFSASVQGQGRSLHIDDDFRDKQKTPYEYTVSVQLDGTSFTSPDPVIVNDPGS
jgi:hypothetical protein